MRPCNLLWYVYSRGPLRPNLPHGPPFPISLLRTDLCTSSAASPACLESHPRLAVACPPGPGHFQGKTGDPHRAPRHRGVSKDAMGAGLLCCDRTGNMWTCLAHSPRPSTNLYSKLAGPGSDVSQDPAVVAAAGGGLGRVPLLIDNKRSFCFPPCLFCLFCSCVDETKGKRWQVLCPLWTLRVKADIDCACVRLVEAILVTSDEGLFCATSRRFKS